MTISTTRRKVLLGLGMTALSACTPAGGGQNGTTTASLSMGSSDRPSEGGVGGTGIVGIVHDTGSLLVNGLRVEIPPDLAARDAFGPLDARDLGPGHAVTIEAAQTGNDGVVARSLVVNHPVIGAIDAVNAGGFRCLGVPVALEPGALLVSSGGRFTPRAGQRVAVSGLWRGGEVVAARVDLLEALEPRAVLAGEVEAGASAAARRLGGLVLVLPMEMTPPSVGSYATVIGRRVGGAFLVERLVKGRFQGLAGPIIRLSVEGYLEPVAIAPGYAVSGLGHSFDAAARLSALANGRALFVGPYDGDFRVRFGLPLPEDVARRGSLLAAVDDGFAPAAAQSTR